MGQRRTKDDAGDAKHHSTPMNNRDKLFREVTKRHKQKIQKFREEEHERQVANWLKDSLGVHGGDCQD